jgi:hypothetical protein
MGCPRNLRPAAEARFVRRLTDLNAVNDAI